MNKAIVITILLLSFNGFVSCFIAECPEASMYYLKSIKTKAIDRQVASLGGDYLSERLYVDTLRNQLAFETQIFVEFAARQKSNTIYYGMMNVAYGCTDSEVINPIEPALSSFSTNREVFYDDSIATSYGRVNPFTNLLTEPNCTAFISFPLGLNLEEEAITEVDLTGSIRFEKGQHEFYFQWTTISGEVMSDTVSVYLDF